MRPLLFRPTHSTRPPEAAAGAAVASAVEELARHFRAELRRAESESEEVSYDRLERAADGRLSDEEQVELDLALEDESQLRLELADLVALRGRLAPAANGRHRRDRQVAGWAIAALLLAAIGAQWAFDRPRDGESAGLSASAALPAASQVLFRDDFESGDSSGWSN